VIPVLAFVVAVPSAMLPITLHSVAAWSVTRVIRLSVIQDPALGIDATGTGTWILALVVDAGTRAIAVVVLNTFRAAAAVRITKVLRQAGARASSIALPANGISSTGTRIAGIPGLIRRGN